MGDESWRTGLQSCSFVSIYACLPMSSPNAFARNTGPLASLERERALCWGKEIAGLNHMCGSWWHCQAGTVSLMDY